MSITTTQVQHLHFLWILWKIEQHTKNPIYILDWIFLLIMSNPFLFHLIVYKIPIHHSKIHQRQNIAFFHQFLHNIFEIYVFLHIMGL